MGRERVTGWGFCNEVLYSIAMGGLSSIDST